MSKVTNKQKIILEKVDPEMTYSMADALEILKSVKSSKFEESVDIAIRLGVDPKNLIKMSEARLLFLTV